MTARLDDDAAGVASGPKGVPLGSPAPIFSDLVELATELRRLLEDVICGDVDSATAAYYVASQVGFIAEVAAEVYGGTPDRGSPCAWLLSPAALAALGPTRPTGSAA
jgi:hypothetical protein